MGYDIVYQRASIDVDEKRFILLTQHGSNNCFQCINGRDVSEKRWDILPLNLLKRQNDPFGHKTVFLNKSELSSLKDELFDRFNEESSDLYKSRNRKFLGDELPKWLFSSTKNMATVEEHKKAWNDIVLTTYLKPKVKGTDIIDTRSTGYDCFNIRDMNFPKSSEELISLVEKYQKDNTIGRIEVGFKSRERLRPTNNGLDPKLYTEFFVLKSPTRNSYLSKMGRNTYYVCGTPNLAKKFKSQRDAEKYLSRWKSKIPNFTFSEIKKIENDQAYI